MANSRSWAWKPEKGTPKPAKLPEGPIRVKGLPRSCVPHVERKTEQAETGNWGRGPGNNVSNVMNGLNTEANRMASHMDRNFKPYFKARKHARRAARVARLQAMGRL